MKKVTYLMSACVVALISASAYADDIRMDLNAGQVKLGSCEGTIEATSSSGGKQMNLVIRDDKNCGSLDVPSVGKTYTGLISNGNHGGSYTIPVGDLNAGLNYVTVTLHSGSNAHLDTIQVPVFVTGPSSTSDAGAACQKSANREAHTRTTFAGTSNSGNLKYDYTDGFQGNKEVVLDPSDCSVKSDQRTGSLIVPSLPLDQESDKNTQSGA